MIEDALPPHDLQRRRFSDWCIWALIGCVLLVAIIVGVMEVRRFANYQVVHSKLISVHEALTKYEDIHGHFPVASLTDEGLTVIEGESWREAINGLARSQIWKDDDSIHFCMIVFQTSLLSETNEATPPHRRALLCDIGDSRIAWTEHCDVYVTSDESRIISANTNESIDLRGKLLMTHNGNRVLIPWELDSKDVPEFLLSVPQW